MARGFKAQYHQDIRRLDVKGQYWSRKDAETLFYMMKTFSGLNGEFDCIIDLTECDQDAIRLERFIEVAIEKGLRYIVIATGETRRGSWMRDGYPIELKRMVSQAETYIEDCHKDREMMTRKAQARERRKNRLEKSNGFSVPV